MSSTVQQSDDDDANKSAPQGSTDAESKTGNVSADSQPSETAPLGSTEEKEKVDASKKRKVSETWFELQEKVKASKKEADALSKENETLRKKEEVRRILAANPEALRIYDSNPDMPEVAIINEMINEGDPIAVSAYHTVFPQEEEKVTNQPKMNSFVPKPVEKEPLTPEKVEDIISMNDRKKLFTQTIKETYAKYPQMEDHDEEEIILKLGGEVVSKSMDAEAFNVAFNALAEKKFGKSIEKANVKEAEIKNSSHQTISSDTPQPVTTIPAEYKEEYQKTKEAVESIGDTLTEQEFIQLLRSRGAI
jgi:hypothetical protein